MPPGGPEPCFFMPQQSVTTAVASFPFQTKLSLEPLIAYWKAGEESANEGIALFSRAVGAQVAAAEWVV